MDTTKKIIKLYSQYKIYILLLLLGIPVISRLDIWSQTMLGTIVDNISNADAWISMVGMYVLVVVSHYVIKQAYSIIEQCLSFNLTYNLRAALAEKVVRIDSEFLKPYSTDEIMHMWNDDVREIQTVSVQSIFKFSILICSAFLALVELGKISLYFPAIALVVNIMAIIPVRIIGRKNKQRSQNQRESRIAMNEKFYTILNAIRLIKSYGKEKEEISEFEKVNSKYVNDKLSFSLSSRIYKSVVTSVKSIAPTVILLIANFQIRDGRMTIGDIVLATTLLETISKPFSEGGHFFINLKGIGFKFEQLFQFLEKQNEECVGKKLEINCSHTLVFDNVSYQMDGVDILENINFTVRPGEKVAIVGESGSGKTTLNNLILRIYTPTAGKLMLDDTDICEFDLTEYRKKIHYSQSNTYLTNATVLQNLTLLGAEKDSCIEMAKAIHFHEEIMAMDGGYDTVIDASGANISGGQKKKIAIIRALAQQKQLYVLDEITRGIDEASSYEIMNYLLDNIAATMILTMHNFSAIERMDKIIVMQSGRIVAEGKHDDLYQSCIYYRELYDNQRRDSNG